jgi:hypothetical protein
MYGPKCIFWANLTPFLFQVRSQPAPPISIATRGAGSEPNEPLQTKFTRYGGQDPARVPYDHKVSIGFRDYSSELGLGRVVYSETEAPNLLANLV